MTSERNRFLVVADRARKVYWRLLGPRTIGVRTIVRDGDGRVLLIRQTYGAGEWQLPGGGVQRRETVDDGARRETVEETGIRPGTLRLHGVFSNLREGKSDHVVVFEVVDWAPEQERGHGEIAEVAWFGLHELPPRTSPGTRRRLDELRTGTTPGFRW